MNFSLQQEHSAPAATARAISGKSRQSVRRTAARNSEGERAPSLWHGEWCSQAMAPGAAAARREAAWARRVLARRFIQLGQVMKGGVERHARARVCELAEGSLQPQVIVSLGDQIEIRVEQQQRSLSHFQPGLGPVKGIFHANLNAARSARFRSSEPRFSLLEHSSLAVPAIDQGFADPIESRHRTAPEWPTGRRYGLTRREGTSDISTTQRRDGFARKAARTHQLATRAIPTHASDR